MDIQTLVKEAHLTALSHGWWDDPVRRPLEIHALIHSEISEATEAVRNRDADNELEELADAVIRIADYCGYKGWNLQDSLEKKMAYNKTRSYRHGGKAV